MKVSVVGDKKFRGTVKDLAEKLHVDYQQASGFVTVLRNQGLAAEVDKQKTVAGKGRSAIVFEIPESFSFDFSE